MNKIIHLPNALQPRPQTTWEVVAEVLREMLTEMNQDPAAIDYVLERLKPIWRTSFIGEEGKSFSVPQNVAAVALEQKEWHLQTEMRLILEITNLLLEIWAKADHKTAAYKRPIVSSKAANVLVALGKGRDRDQK